jgi:hypothetical protein
MAANSRPHCEPVLRRFDVAIGCADALPTSDMDADLFALFVNFASSMVEMWRAQNAHV